MYDDDVFIVGKDNCFQEGIDQIFFYETHGCSEEYFWTGDRSKRMLWMSQEDYIKKVFERFNMQNTQPVHVLLPNHLKLSKTISRE